MANHFTSLTKRRTPLCINVWYGDHTTVIRAESRYGPLLLGPTGHRPLHLRLTILNLPPNLLGDGAKGLPLPLKMPSLQDKQAWSQYNRAIDRALRNQQDPTDLLTAMRTAAVTGQPQAEDGQPPTALGYMLHAL